MARLTQLVTLLLTLLFSVHAKIHHHRLDQDGSALVQITPPYHFTNGGGIEVSLRDIHTKDDRDGPDHSHLGLILLPPAAEAEIRADMALLADTGACILQQDSKAVLFTFADSGVETIINQPRRTETTMKFQLRAKGNFAIYFVNCCTGTVSFDSTVEFKDAAESFGDSWLTSAFASLKAAFYKVSRLLRHGNWHWLQDDANWHWLP